MMDALTNIIPKSIIEVLNRLENDEDNRYSCKLTRNQDSLSLTVSCKLPAKTPNKAKDDSAVTERATVKPVRHRRKKRNSDIFIHTYGLDHFFFLFNFFFGGGGGIFIHFRLSLKARYRMGIFFCGHKISNIYLGMLDMRDIFNG